MNQKVLKLHQENCSSIEAFEFKTQCFICGKDCAVKADPKNPSRFKKNPGVLCTTADRGSVKFEDGREVKRKSFKQVMLDVCNNRSDKLAEEVRVRLEGAQVIFMPLRQGNLMYSNNFGPTYFVDLPTKDLKSKVINILF